MKSLWRNLLKNRKGQALVEYGILVGGIALVCLAATAILGHKANDLIATTAASLPGAHTDDNGPIGSGKLVKTTSTANGLVIDATAPGTIQNNLGIPNIGSLVLEIQ